MIQPLPRSPSAGDQALGTEAYGGHFPLRPYRLGVKCLPAVHKPLALILTPHNPGMMVHPYDPSTGAVETGEPRVQDHPQLHTELMASLDYMRLSQKKIIFKPLHLP